MIHREDNMMYYGYIRRMEQSEEDYIGFCILLNGVMLTLMEQLASLFERACEKASAFFIVETAERVSPMIKEGVAEMGYEALPPMVYGISKEETKRFADMGDNGAIVETAAKYPWVVVENNKARETLVKSGESACVPLTAEQKTKEDVPVNGVQELAEVKPMMSPEPTDRKRPMPKTWLVESILVTVLCCLPFGIAGLVNATKVETCYVSGEYERAEQLSQQAKKWATWGVWSTIAVYFLAFVIVVVGAINNQRYC